MLFLFFYKLQENVLFVHRYIFLISIASDSWRPAERISHTTLSLPSRVREAARPPLHSRERRDAATPRVRSRSHDRSGFVGYYNSPG